MDFECDPRKSRSNLQKRGIDSDQAKALWDDPRAMVVRAKTVEEERFAILAQCMDKVWTCIFIIREERIRISP